jgi:hypothetical protein
VFCTSAASAGTASAYASRPRVERNFFLAMSWSVAGMTPAKSSFQYCLLRMGHFPAGDVPSSSAPAALRRARLASLARAAAAPKESRQLGSGGFVELENQR